MGAARLDLSINIGEQFRRIVTFQVLETGEPWDFSDILTEVRVGGKIKPQDKTYQWYATTGIINPPDNPPATPPESPIVVASGTATFHPPCIVSINIPSAETEKLKEHTGAWNLELEFRDGTVVRALSGRYKAIYEVIY